MAAFVHVGQCGNQLALPFWKAAHAQHRHEVERSGVAETPLFRTTRPDAPDGGAVARAILVDAEPKAVTAACRGLPPGLIHPGNVALDHSGRANNWSMGFESCRSEEAAGRGLFVDACEAVRHEAERSDRLRALVLTQSLAGGTGSGLGSALVQHLRDFYPGLWLLPVAVGPFSRGDTPLQQYNSLFSVMYLQHFADGVIFTDNDELERTLTQARALIGTRGGDPAGGGGLGRSKVPPDSSVSLAAMNDLLALDLAALLLPTTPLVPPATATASRAAMVCPDVETMLTHACPSRELKWLEVRSSLAAVPVASGVARRRRGKAQDQRFVSWTAVAADAVRFAPPRDAEQRPVMTLAASGMLRGCKGVGGAPRTTARTRGARATSASRSGAAEAREDGSALWTGRPHASDPAVDSGAVRDATAAVTRGTRVVRWNTTPVDLACSAGAAFPKASVERSAAVLSNRTHIAAKMRHTLTRAAHKFCARAYVHWSACTSEPPTQPTNRPIN